MNELLDTMKVSVIRSNRKSVAIQIKDDCSVTVRAPMYATKVDIERILKEKEAWILKHIEQMKPARAEFADGEAKKLTYEELQKLADRAMEYIPERVRFFSKKMGVSYGRITIRNQRTKWGSCSSKGNLNFNCLLMLTPPEVIDYVVVHELCHRKEMNHSRKFWSEVESVLPDYKEPRKWLKEKGSAVMRRNVC